MSQKLSLAFAACLPIALAACSGGGTPTPGPDMGPSEQTELSSDELRQATTARTAAQETVRDAEQQLRNARTPSETADATLRRDAARAEVTYLTARVNLERANLAIERARQRAQDASTPAEQTAARNLLQEAETLLGTAVSGARAGRQEAQTAASSDSASRATATVRASAQLVLNRATEFLELANAFSTLANQRIAAARRLVPEPTEPGSGSGGSSGSYVQSRVQDLNVTHVEMTDLWVIEDEFSVREAVCNSETQCTVLGESAGMFWEGWSGASDQSNGFALFRPDPINRVEVSFKTEVVGTAAVGAPSTEPRDVTPTTSTTSPVVTDTNTYIGGIGQHSGFFTTIAATRLLTGGLLADGFSYAGGYSSAFGERHSGGRPSATATWRGAMVGQMREGAFNGAQLVGEAVLTYSVADNTIDVEFAQIRTYGGAIAAIAPNFDLEESLAWYDLAVNRDGTFHIPGYTNDRTGTRLHPTLGYIEGDFYGPNAEETAGVFERGSVQGAWLAIEGN